MTTNGAGPCLPSRAASIPLVPPHPPPPPPSFPPQSILETPPLSPLSLPSLATTAGEAPFFFPLLNTNYVGSAPPLPLPSLPLPLQPLLHPLPPTHPPKNPPGKTCSRNTGQSFSFIGMGSGCSEVSLSMVPLNWGMWTLSLSPVPSTLIPSLTSTRLDLPTEMWLSPSS